VEEGDCGDRGRIHDIVEKKHETGHYSWLSFLSLFFFFVFATGLIPVNKDYY